MSLRSELDDVFRYEASVAEPARELLTADVENRRPRKFSTDEWLEALFALQLGLREALFRLADQVERIEMRLGPENRD